MARLSEALVLVAGAVAWGAFCLILGIAVGDLRVGAAVFLALLAGFALLLSLASQD